MRGIVCMGSINSRVNSVVWLNRGTKSAQKCGKSAKHPPSAFSHTIMANFFFENLRTTNNLCNFLLTSFSTLLQHRQKSAKVPHSYKLSIVKKIKLHVWQMIIYYEIS